MRADRICERIHEPGGAVALTWSHNYGWDIEDWRDRSACRDIDPELFFPIGTTGPAIEQIESAKAVSRDCEVHGACLEVMLATSQDSCEWGGISENEHR